MPTTKKQDGPVVPEGATNADVARNREPGFDSAPVLDKKTGNVLLSEDIRDEQEREGFVPDVQPKASPVGAVPTVVGGTLQPTGNLAVLTAIQAAKDPNTIIQTPEATKESDTEIVVDPAVGTAGFSPSVKQIKADATDDK